MSGSISQTSIARYYFSRIVNNSKSCPTSKKQRDSFVNLDFQAVPPRNSWCVVWHPHASHRQVVKGRRGLGFRVQGSEFSRPVAGSYTLTFKFGVWGFWVEGQVSGYLGMGSAYSGISSVARCRI